MQKLRIETQELHTGSDPDCQSEVETLRAQLADCRSQLRSKSIELEKSTQLFTMFDQ